MELVVLSITYVNMKVTRGDWWGESARQPRRTLWDFARWVPRRVAQSVAAVKLKHVQGFLDAAGTAHSAQYRRHRLGTLRGFFGWLRRTGRIQRDPTEGAHVPDVPESAPRAFSDDDVATLFSQARSDPRTLVCVSLLWNEGFRRIEVARAQIDDIDDRTRTIGVRGKFYRGEISRRAALSDETIRAIDRYLATVPHRGTGPLVRSRRNIGEGLDRDTIGRIVAQCIRDAGLKRFPWDGRSSHAGRHTAATQSLEAGVPPTLIKRQFGWKSDAMLERYGKSAALDLHVVHELRDERRRTLGAPSG